MQHFSNHKRPILLALIRVQRSKFTSTVGKCQGFRQGISICFLLPRQNKQTNKKSTEAIEFLGILRNIFPRIKNYTLLFEKEDKYFAQ